MTLARPDDIDLVNLDHIIANYNSETDRCLAAELPVLEGYLWAQIHDYDRTSKPGDDGLADHLRHISLDAAEFLVTLGFEAKAAENLRRAVLFSKLGHLHKGNDHISFGPAGPSREQDQRSARELGDDGCAVLSAALEGMSGELQAHPHIRIVIPALMRFRHECVNGRGPYARDGAEMGLIVRIMAIIDAYARQFNCAQTTPAAATPMEAIERMSGNTGQDTPLPFNSFDRKLLETYARLKTRGTPSGNTRGVSITREMAVESA